MKHAISAVLLLLALLPAGAALAQDEQLISVLRSDASLEKKADACRQLARVGTRKAVPALAGLLADPILSDMARFALEPIADPSVDVALRGALTRVRGRLLIGVISSLAVRKDFWAIKPLAGLLTNPDTGVAQAAARALGAITGETAPLLLRALDGAGADNRAAICDGLLRCAESLPRSRAVTIYDRLRKVPGLPRYLRVAALRGAILSRGPNGIPMVVQAIRTESYVPAADALRISAEIPGVQMTRALAGELPRAGEAKRILLVEALGNRGDVAAASALMPLARRGRPDVRIAAIRGLAQLGSPSALPVLLALLSDADAQVSASAQAALVGFPGRTVDSAVVLLLSKPGARASIPLIQVASERCITASVPALLRAARASDSGVRDASLKALADLAGPADIPAIVEAMLRGEAVPAAENALSAICSRQRNPSDCAAGLLPGLARAQGEPRLALLRVLGAIGGPKALAAVRAASTDSDQSVKAAALRLLCEWPTADALPDLARIAGAISDSGVRTLALRGQLRLIREQSAPAAQKLLELNGVVPLVERKDEKTLVLATLGDLANPDSLTILMPYLTDESVREEASAAAVAIAEKVVAGYPAETRSALMLVQTQNAALAERAKNVLARVRAGAVEAGFTSLFNGKDMTGWDGKPGWWSVQDGCLTAESTPQKPCPAPNYLIWRGGQPADFEIRAEFKLSRSANSGIQIRSEERPDWDTFGYQADMTGDGELVGFVYHHSRGLIAGRGERAVFAPDGKKTADRIGDPAELLKHFRVEDWNTYRVICRGAEISLYVNGVLMCHITDHSAQAAARGIIALQMHPGPPMKVQFRNIRLKVF